jgi:hypothetical protein
LAAGGPLAGPLPVSPVGGVGAPLAVATGGPDPLALGPPVAGPLAVG